MASRAYTEGFYYLPRVDKKLIEEYKEDLIVLTGNMYGEVPSKILNLGENQAEEALLWWKKTLRRWSLYRSNASWSRRLKIVANEVLINFAHKHHVKIVATNNTYYVHKEDANAHDIYFV